MYNPPQQGPGHLVLRPVLGPSAFLVPEGERDGNPPEAIRPEKDDDSAAEDVASQRVVKVPVDGLHLLGPCVRDKGVVQAEIPAYAERARELQECEHEPRGGKLPAFAQAREGVVAQTSKEASDPGRGRPPRQHDEARDVLDASRERYPRQRPCDAQRIEGKADHGHDGERRDLDRRVEIRRRDKRVKAPAFPSDTFHRRASNEEPLQTLHRQVRHFFSRAAKFAKGSSRA